MGYLFNTDFDAHSHCVFQPWQVKYRIAEHPERTLSAQLDSLNGHLRVKEKGLYEILEVGSVSS